MGGGLDKWFIGIANTNQSPIDTKTRLNFTLDDLGQNLIKF